MVVLDKKEHGAYTIFSIQANQGERYATKELFEHEGKIYRISSVAEIEGTKLPEYNLVMEELKKTTKYDYRRIAFEQVLKIERLTQTQIKVHYSNRSYSIHNFNTPDECLKDYVYLMREVAQANGRTR